MAHVSERATCPVAGACGACSYIDVPYAEQLARKDAAIAELFADACGAEANGGEAPEIRPITGMEDPFHYRSKVASPFAPGKRVTGSGARAGAGRKNKANQKCAILTGMYTAGTHTLVNTDGCLVDDERANSVVAAIRRIMQRYDMQPYNEDTGEGFVRHVVVRAAHASGEMLVTVVTNGHEFLNSRAFCRELVKRCPYITTIVQNVNMRQTNVILGAEEHTLYGPGFILDTLLGLSFRISSKSFYQTNAAQTEVLYEQAMQFAQLDTARSVIDAYCGTGTIGLVAAARSGAHAVGVDSVESAIRDARENARHNGIKNAEFVTADATVFLSECAAFGEPVDVLFMDPPRAGSTPGFLTAAAALGPARIVYISCNPATQVRDVELLQQYGYRLRIVQPVDMFPHTDHVETVALLTRD